VRQPFQANEGAFLVRLENKTYGGMMTVHVNGEAKQLADGATVAQLIDVLALGEVRIAVEVNKDLVVRKAWETHVLKDGDRVEVVTFVGGG